MAWFTNRRDLRHLRRRLARALEQLEAVKSRYDTPDALVYEFEADRRTENYRSVFDQREPLVSICVATYHEPELLVNRCLRSLLGQTYRNLEIVVVGDGCTDDTSARMAQIRDTRVRYENLSGRTGYPEDPVLRWMVAGTPAMNRAMQLSTGDFITHLDHDDEHMPDRVEKLVTFIQKTRSDLVFHPFFYQRNGSRVWELRRARGFQEAQVTTSSVLYHRYLKTIEWDLLAYRFLEPGDWNRFRRMKHLGVRCARFDEPLLKKYGSQSLEA